MPSTPHEVVIDMFTERPRAWSLRCYPGSATSYPTMRPWNPTRSARPWWRLPTTTPTNKKTYLSPLVLMDGMYDKSMEEVAASAAALSGVPVSTSPRQLQ